MRREAWLRARATAIGLSTGANRYDSVTPLVDSHCHLADAKLRDEVVPILERAEAAGVDYIVTVGALGPLESDRLTVELAERHAGLFAAIGVHPHHARDCDAQRLAQVRDLARSQKVVALGETGLDYYYMHSPPEAQRRSLTRHLELASELGLPVVIHCRERAPKRESGRAATGSAQPGEATAWEEIFAIAREVGFPAAGGVAHCFTGDRAAALECLECGLYISFSGIVTFRNAAALLDIASAVPDDRILVETDAPYLTPEPYRGRRNEPAYVRFTLAALAKARGVTPEHLAALVLANAGRLFRIPQR